MGGGAAKECSPMYSVAGLPLGFGFIWTNWHKHDPLVLGL